MPNTVRSIQVSGFRVYQGGQLMDGFRAYLQGVLTGDPAICGRQKINFNNTTLRMGGNGQYYAYYVHTPDTGRRPAVRRDDHVINVSSLDYEVELALDAFVENERIRQLNINLATGSISLTRNPRKPRKILISTEGLPSMTETMRDFGYKV